VIKGSGPPPSILSLSEKDQGSKDYLALGVFVVILIALFTTVYVGIRSISNDFISEPAKYASKLLRDIEKYSKRRLGDTIKDVRRQRRQPRGAEKHISLGYKLHNKKEFNKALEEFNRAIKIDPENHKAYYWRARTLVKTGHYDKAITDFKMAAKLRPDFAEAYGNLGWLYARRKDYDESIYYLTKFIKMKPNNGWAYYNRGRCYFMKDDLETALKDAKKACELGYKEGCEVNEKYKK